MMTLALVICAAEPPPTEAPSPPEPRAASYAIGAIEIELYHLGYLAFSNLVTRMPFAQLDGDAIAGHFDGRQSWTFDVDYYDTNQLAHPYQGALYFSAARSAGLPFWTSAIYTFAGSLVWELLFENDAPSINDQITTSLGGTFLGEMMFRAGLTIWDSDLPRFIAVPASFVVDPPGTFNRLLLGHGPERGDPQSWSGHLAAGLSVADELHDVRGGSLSQGQLPNISVKLSYRDGTSAPFGWFDVDGRLEPVSMPLTVLFLRGMLKGSTFSVRGGELSGIWGLVGAYDFTAQPVSLRASVVGVGIGGELTWRFSRAGYLRAVSTNELVPFGSIGSLGLDEDYARDYHIGLGYSGAASIELGHTQAGAIYAGVRQWMIAGTFTPTAGYELLTRADLGVSVRLGGPFAAGLEWTFVWRQPYFDDAWYDRSIRGQSARAWVGVALGELL